MPSSDYNTIPKVMDVITALNPTTVLDIGCGTGKYGMLFREYLDLNYGRLSKHEWNVIVDGLDVDSSYFSGVHLACYSNLIKADWLTYEIDKNYDLIFMGDVLEHWTHGDWQKALSKARCHSVITLVVCPNWAGSINQGPWHGHDQETHRVVLSPELVGGRCLYANSKIFMCGFDNAGVGVLNNKAICL